MARVLLKHGYPLSVSLQPAQIEGGKVVNGLQIRTRPVPLKAVADATLPVAGAIGLDEGRQWVDEIAPVIDVTEVGQQVGSGFVGRPWGTSEMEGIGNIRCQALCAHRLHAADVGKMGVDRLPAAQIRDHLLSHHGVHPISAAVAYLPQEGMSVGTQDSVGNQAGEAEVFRVESAQQLPLADIEAVLRMAGSWLLGVQIVGVDETGQPLPDG